MSDATNSETYSWSKIDVGIIHMHCCFLGCENKGKNGPQISPFS